MKKRQNSFKVSTTIGFPPFFIVFVFFSIFCSVPCNVCDVTVCSSCVCCVVGQNPSQTSAWCPMVTAQLANMTGDTYFLFLFLFLIGRAKRAPHWVVQSRFCVIYIYICCQYVVYLLNVKLTA